MGTFQNRSVEWSTTTTSIRIYIILNIYINELDHNIKSNVLKFADDIKECRKVNNDDDKQQHLLNDLEKLVKRCEK